MISIDEYVKLRETPIQMVATEELSMPMIGVRIASSFDSRHVNTFGDLFDNLQRLIYFRQIGPKARDVIYDLMFHVLKIEDKMPADYDYQNYINKAIFDNPKYKILSQTIAELESKRNTREKEEIEASEIYKGLLAQGIDYVNNLSKEYFERGCKKQEFLSKCVEHFLRFKTWQMMQSKTEETQIEKTIESLKQQYKATIELKRGEFGSSAFFSKMAKSISEVRKYKVKNKTNKEEKDFNPYYTDGETL